MRKESQKTRFHPQLTVFFSALITCALSGYLVEVFSGPSCRYPSGADSLFRSVHCAPDENDRPSERTKIWISLVFWATELNTSLSSSICQPASINKSSSGNRARYGFIEVDISTGLDELIDLGKPSSICRYRARNVEDGEARTLTFPGGQVECYRAR